MLSLQDCLDLTELSDGELAAIVRHEKIPPIVALELGHRLMQTPGGMETLRQFILDDVASAQRQNRCRDCEAFSQALAGFMEKHPEGQSLPPDQSERLPELLAIGKGEEAGKAAKRSAKRQKAALRDVEEAKARHDCDACGRLSLRLLRLVEGQDSSN